MFQSNTHRSLANHTAGYRGAGGDTSRVSLQRRSDHLPPIQDSLHVARRDIHQTHSVGLQQFNTIHVTQIRDLYRKSEDVHDEVSFEEATLRPVKKEVGAFVSLLRETQKLLDRSKGFGSEDESRLEEFREESDDALNEIKDVFARWRTMSAGAKELWLENEGKDQLSGIVERLQKQTAALNELQLPLQSIENQLRRFVRTQNGDSVSGDSRVENLGDPDNWAWLREELRRFGMSETFLTRNGHEIQQKLPEILQEDQDFEADQRRQEREIREEMELFDETAVDSREISYAPITTMTINNNEISRTQLTRLRLSAFWNGGVMLREAAAHGELAIVEELAPRVPNVDDADHLGWTALHWAVVYGFSDMVSSLLDAGANPNARTNINQSCLFLAAAYGRKEILEVLLEHRADPNVGSSSGYLPIHEAAYVGSTPMINALYAYGSDVDVQANDGRTPLMMACFTANYAVVLRLLELCENRNRLDSDGLDALAIAAQKGVVPIIKLLLEHTHGPPIDRRSNNGYTALDRAATSARPNAVRYLLGFNPNVNNEDSRSYFTLHKAAVGGNREIAEMLIDAGAVVNRKSGEGWTPLHQTAWSGRLQVAEQLIVRGAVVSARDHYGWTPLHRAAYKGHYHLVDLLLQKGASTDDRDVSSFTALHNAASRGHAPIVKLLLEYQAELDARTTDDWTPLHEAAFRGHSRCVSLLIQYGANILDVDSQGYTALDKARAKGHKGIEDALASLSDETYEANVDAFSPDDLDFNISTDIQPTELQAPKSSWFSGMRDPRSYATAVSAIVVLGTTITWVLRQRKGPLS